MKDIKKQAHKNAEMSLDEVLSSIRKMVIDEEPPVLDLTDMIKPDGSIEKVKVGPENSEMGAFLKLVQENADAIGENNSRSNESYPRYHQETHDVSADAFSHSTVTPSGKEFDKKETVSELLRETSISLINKWINNNLPDIAKNVVEEKIRELLKR
jgi:cell pole-organizing protein PopZ